jgi:hypothetical protein
MKEEKTITQKIFETQVQEMVEDGGFTEQQAIYLLNLLNRFIPII